MEPVITKCQYNYYSACQAASITSHYAHMIHIKFLVLIAYSLHIETW